MTIEIREVIEKDWNFILKIRNQSSSRLAFHDTSITSIDTHRSYMTKLCDDPNSFQWIVTYDGIDVGHTKIINHEFGYILEESFRGKGIGTKIYELVFREAKKLGIDKLHDTIKIEQKIALRVALKVGFIQKEIIKKNDKPYAYSLEKILD
jgi:RimJ/RimL family protein N-acetyltransferase